MHAMGFIRRVCYREKDLHISKTFHILISVVSYVFTVRMQVCTNVAIMSEQAVVSLMIHE